MSFAPRPRKKSNEPCLTQREKSSTKKASITLNVNNKSFESRKVITYSSKIFSLLEWFILAIEINEFSIS
jgi:hypothetical protein